MVNIYVNWILNLFILFQSVRSISSFYFMMDKKKAQRKMYLLFQFSWIICSKCSWTWPLCLCSTDEQESKNLKWQLKMFIPLTHIWWMQQKYFSFPFSRFPSSISHKLLARNHSIPHHVLNITFKQVREIVHLVQNWTSGCWPFDSQNLPLV